MLFVQALLVVGVLGGAMTVTGRMACALVGPLWLRRPTTENYALAAFVGTAIWAMLAAWAGYLGATAPQSARVLGAGVALLAAWAAWRGRLGWLRPPLGRDAIGVGCGVGVGTSLALLSLLVSDGFWVYSDAPTYVGTAGWLQTHGYWEQWRHADRPGVRIMGAYLGAPPIPGFSFGGGEEPPCQSLRMWAQFLYATCVALVPGRDPLRLFLPVAAWGFVLNLGGILLLSRWALRLNRVWAAAAVFIAAAMMNPLHFSVGGGYFPQLFGTGSLATYVALLCRMQAPCRRGARSAALLALVVVALIGFYSEMVPLLVLVSLPVLARLGWRSWRSGRGRAFAGFAGLTFAAVAVLGNYELLRAARAVRMQLKTYDIQRVEWARVEFWSFALGTFPYNPLALPAGNLATVYWLLAAVATAAVAVGARALFRRRPFPLSVAVGLLVVMGLYFSLIALDPWDGRRGHTWNVWKSCKWVYPLFVPVIALGLSRALGARPGRLALAASAALVLAVSLPVHLAYARTLGAAVTSVTGSKGLVRDWPEFRKAVRATGAEEVCLVHGPRDNLADIFALLYVPGEFIQVSGPEPAGLRSPKRLFVGWNALPFETEKRRLPAGFVVLDVSRPLVLKVHATYGLDKNAIGETYAWLGSEPGFFEVWAPEPGAYHLKLSAGTPQGEPDDQALCLTVRGPDTIARKYPLSRGREVSVAIDLPGGVSTLGLTCPPAVPLPPSAGVAARGAWVTHVRLERATPLPASRSSP